MTNTGGPGWSGADLKSPEDMAAFTTQLRSRVEDLALLVAGVRRTAEAMWKANPPEGYSTFEAWWRHWWVTSPFAEIQDHLERAAAETFKLEARYRKGRHEIPAKRIAARQQSSGPALGSGNYGRRDTSAARPRPNPPPVDEGTQFIDLLNNTRRERSA